MKTTTERDSNFELMRIIAMIYIVIFHVILHGNLMYTSQGGYRYLVMFIYSLTVIHVNSFILLTGYFQCEKDIKASKIITLNNASWFYRILFLAIATFSGIKLLSPVTKIEKMRMLLPIDYGMYWYINVYLILYIISPILNITINNMNKKQHFNTILILIFLYSIIPTLTAEGAIYTSAGRSVAIFILLYFIGAYIKKYPLENNKYLAGINKTKMFTISLIGYLICAVIGLMSFTMNINLSNYGIGMNEISKIFGSLFSNYGSPIIILQTIFFFYMFKSISLKSKLINHIAKCTIGIYLVHENLFVRNNLYSYLGIPELQITTLIPLLKILALAVGLFIIGLIVESIRLIIFKFIYNRKISKKFRVKYRDYFEKLGFNINW